MSESHTNRLLEKITLVSYNCRGFNKYKAPYIGNLMRKCSFLFVQEHWLCDAQISSLNCNNSSFMVHGISGFDNNQVLHGRPFGGTAILWHKNFDATVKAVQTNSNRISAVAVTAKDINVLLINVYMPVDDGSIDKYDIFVNEMYKIRHLIEIHSQYLPVVGGDFNIDLNRDSLHSRFFSEFLVTHHLCCADVIKDLNTDYTYNFGMQRFSLIDHFVLLQSNANIIDNLYVAHDADNLSDHDPLFLSLSMNLRMVTLSQRHLSYRVAWFKANEECLTSYKNRVTNNLNLVNIPTPVLMTAKVRTKNEKW